ncbi:hypothetical protein GGI12_003101 [Dipsacomyces acuminosporus]|nr:hypothetical protein GGI12_003101 [Dipsacomyces acuminosporus]
MDGMRTPVRRTVGNPAPLASPFKTPVKLQYDHGQPGTAARDQANQPLADQPNSSAMLSPKGKWFNPEAQKVLDDRACKPSERQSTMRLRWNVASLVVLAWCSQTGVYRQIKSVGLATGIPQYIWSSLEWLGLAVLAYNIGEAVWYLLQPKNEYTGLAMTPSQRRRIGLDSQATATTGAAPISAPKMTPSRSSARKQTPGSVTDIESRRRTPIKGAGSATPSGTKTTPRSLRSPVSLSAGAGQGDYSTEDDVLTLTQVLKKVPGASSITDNALATPTRTRPSDSGYTLSSPYSRDRIGDVTMATPRLPVSRYGINDPIAATPLQQHLRSQPAIGFYQTATPASRTHGNEGSKGSSKDRISGDVDYFEPHEVLEKYGVEREILDWVENMHSWFVRHLLRPLCKQIDELDALFEQNGLAHLSCRQAVLDTAALEQAKANDTATSTFGSGFRSTALGGSFGSGLSSFSQTQPAQNTQTTPQNLVELSMRYGDLPQTKERMALEKYLLVPGTSCRGYVIQRVHTLAQSGALPAYTFDGGGSYIPNTGTGASTGARSNTSTSTAQEHRWNPAIHPTDAQLLFHLFCVFMDQTMPPVQNTRHPFTDRYVLQLDRKPDNNLPVQIVQVARKRPHFCLIVKGSFYDVTANRNNLFITLILFVLEIQKECAGYLGLTNLGGKHVDLLSVVKK